MGYVWNGIMGVRPRRAEKWCSPGYAGLRMAKSRVVRQCCCVSHGADLDAEFGEQPQLAARCPMLSVFGERGWHLGAGLCVACARGFLVVR